MLLDTYTKSRILNTYSPSLQGLRSIAVLLVIVNHAMPNFMPGGYIGVDVFFVLSGYFITKNIKTEMESNIFTFKKFYIRRFLRIYPAMLSVVGITLIFGILLLSPELLKSLATSAFFTSISNANHYFLFDSGYFSNTRMFKPLLHTWSLAVEEQFYIFWPLLLFILTGKQFQKVPIILLIIIFSLIFSQWFIENNPDLSFYIMPTRVFELGAGALLAYLNLPKLKDRYISLFDIGIIILFICAFTYTESTIFPGFNAIIPVIATMGIILDKNNKNSLNTKLLNTSLFQYYGNISYSLYLVHWPLLVYINYWFWDYSNYGITNFLIYFTVATIISHINYCFIEKNFRIYNLDKKNKLELIQTTKLKIVSISTIVIILISVVIFFIDGMNFRIKQRNYLSKFALEEKELINQYPIVIDPDNLGRRWIGPEKQKSDILILGDSHATMHKYYLTYLAHKHYKKIEMWALLGCPALLGVSVKFDRPSKYENNCNDGIKKWENYIKSEESPDTVWLLARWKINYEHAKHGQIYPSRHSLSKPGEIINKNPEISREVFKESLDYTISTMVENKKNVVIFSQVANSGRRSLKECANTPTFLFSPIQFSRRCISVSKAEILKRSKFTDNTIENISMKYNNVSAIIPNDFFCSTDSCLFFDPSTKSALWEDEDHLTLAGSKLLLNEYETELFR